MRKYWQFDFFVDGKHKIRYFYGTEAAANRRAKRYEGDSKELIVLDKAMVISLKEKKVHIIHL